MGLKLKKAPNSFWYQRGPLEFSKVNIKQNEINWLAECIPTAKFGRKRVENSKWMPAYKQGKWDGYTTTVTFETVSQAVMFKLRWWF